MAVKEVFAVEADLVAGVDKGVARVENRDVVAGDVDLVVNLDGGGDVFFVDGLFDDVGRLRNSRGWLFDGVGDSFGDIGFGGSRLFFGIGRGLRLGNFGRSGRLFVELDLFFSLLLSGLFSRNLLGLGEGAAS